MPGAGEACRELFYKRRIQNAPKMKKDSAAATSLWWMNGQGGRSGRPINRYKYSIAQSGEKWKPQNESAKEFFGKEIHYDTDKANWEHEVSGQSLL